MKSMGKDQGVSKTNREIEMFIKSRQAQKDFLATDVVCRELTLKGCHILAHVGKMKKWSQICRGERKTKLGQIVQIKYYGDLEMKNIH